MVVRSQERCWRRSGRLPIYLPVRREQDGRKIGRWTLRLAEWHNAAASPPRSVHKDTDDALTLRSIGSDSSRLQRHASHPAIVFASRQQESPPKAVGNPFSALVLPAQPSNSSRVARSRRRRIPIASRGLACTRPCDLPLSSSDGRWRVDGCPVDGVRRGCRGRGPGSLPVQVRQATTARVQLHRLGHSAGTCMPFCRPTEGRMHLIPCARRPAKSGPSSYPT